jgi:hypothetical protein
MDLLLPSSLADGEYTGNVTIEAAHTISGSVHFWRVTMMNPHVQVWYSTYAYP